jgi:hypothetical protein
MFSEQLGAAIAAAMKPAEIDEAAKLLWRAYANGAVSEAEAQQLDDLVQARRMALGSFRTTVRSRRTSFVRLRPQRSPDRARSMERRRRLAASGPLPPALASAFTTGEQATLRIVGDEVADKGVCDRTLDEIAARAGVSRSTAKRALRVAALLGLVAVEERRRPGRPNLANIVRIVSRAWLVWLAYGRRRQGGGVQSWTGTDNKRFSRGERGESVGGNTTSRDNRLYKPRNWLRTAENRRRVSDTGKG